METITWKWTDTCQCAPSQLSHTGSKMAAMIVYMLRVHSQEATQNLFLLPQTDRRTICPVSMPWRTRLTCRLQPPYAGRGRLVQVVTLGKWELSFSSSHLLRLPLLFAPTCKNTSPSLKERFKHFGKSLTSFYPLLQPTFVPPTDPSHCTFRFFFRHLILLLEPRSVCCLQVLPSSFLF